jgi:hypothetical protein
MNFNKKNVQLKKREGSKKLGWSLRPAYNYTYKPSETFYYLTNIEINILTLPRVLPTISPIPTCFG